MDISIKYKEGTKFVDRVILDISPMESLDILKALNFAFDSPEINPLDRLSMGRILKDWKDFNDSGWER